MARFHAAASRDAGSSRHRTKFSLRHIAAMVLSGYDTAELSVFSDKVANEPTPPRTTATCRGPRRPRCHFETKVEIALAAGMSLSMAADVSKASFPDEELDRRLDKNSARSWGR